MNILLACANTSLNQRWQTILAPEHTVFEATSANDLRIRTRESDFAVILLHASLAGIDAVRAIAGAMPSARLFMLADRPSDEDGLLLLKLGVVGYANSFISADRLREAVRVIAGGGVWINQALMQRLIRSSRPPQTSLETSPKKPQTTGPLQQLSNREYEIATLVAQGLTNQEIASRLAITERTVKAHLSAIFAKTATRGRLNLALLINRPA